MGVLDQAAEGKYQPQSKTMYLATKNLEDDYSGVVEVVSTSFREHDENSKNAGKEFFLATFRVVDPGSLQLVDKNGILYPAEEEDEFSMYFGLSGKKSYVERSIQDIIEVTAAMSPDHREKDFQGTNVNKLYEVHADSDAFKATRLMVQSKPENKGYRNPHFTGLEADLPAAKPAKKARK